MRSQYKSYPFGDTFLVMAHDRGHAAIASVLQEALATSGRCRHRVETGEIDYGHDEDQRRFDKALHEGDRAQVERALAERPDLARNELSSWGEGVLMMPAGRRNRPLLDVLMQYGAQVPAVSKWGRFYYFKHDDIAAWLVRRGMTRSTSAGKA